MRRRVWKRSAEDEVIEIEPGALSGLFAAPRWLRDLGFSAWLLVGVGAALVGLIWLLSLTQTIVMPVITAGIIASVASPLVDGLRRHGLPRGIGAALVLLAIVALGFGVGLVVLTGIASQAQGLSDRPITFVVPFTPGSGPDGGAAFWFSVPGTMAPPEVLARS